MNISTTTTEAAGTLIVQACDEKIAAGWQITARKTYSSVDKYCCPLGAVAGGISVAARKLGVPGKWAVSLADGFDNYPLLDSHDPEAFELGLLLRKKYLKDQE